MPKTTVVDDVPGGLVLTRYVLRDGRLERDEHSAVVAEIPRMPRSRAPRLW